MLRRLTVPLALVVMVVAGCDRAAPTESALRPASAATLDQSNDRPFRFTLTGNANPQFTDPCNATNSESGTGNAEHLGQVSWSSSETVAFCIDPNNPGAASVTGTMVITAANGDQLTLGYNTTVNADFAGGTLTATGTYTVLGGTGRFADASGSGTINVSGSLAPPFAVTGTLSGRLDY